MFKDWCGLAISAQAMMLKTDYSVVLKMYHSCVFFALADLTKPKAPVSDNR